MFTRKVRFTKRVLATAAVAAAALLAAPPTSAQSESYTLIAGRAVMPDGSLRENVAVEVRGGKIERIVEANRVSSNANVIRLPEGAVLSPGLIDLSSSLGVEGSQVEQTRSIDPDINILDGFDPRAHVLRRALEAGITSAMIIPAPATIVSGRAATVRTADIGASSTTDGALVINISSGAFDAQRGPTSRAGLLFELRAALKEAKAKPASDQSPLARAVRGEQRVVLYCGTVEDIDAALMLIAEYGLDAALSINDAAIEMTDDLADAEVPVIFGPLDFNSTRRSLVLPGLLAESGVAIGFRGWLPNREPESLRTTAALAVRAGMDAAAARRALTSGAAAIAGVDAKVGALKEGLDADFVVFSDDPLRLDAKVLDVRIAGKRFYAASHDHTHHGGGAP